MFVFVVICISHQAASVWIDGVGEIDKSGAVFGILRKLFVVVEPAVLRSREAFVLQASQLRRRSYSYSLWHAAPWHDRFHWTQARSHVG